MSERRPNRVQRRDLHSGLRGNGSADYTGSGDRLNISAVPMGPARGHLDGYYPAPTIRDGVIGPSKLDPTGAGDGSGFVYNGITEAYELATICTGAGIIGRIPYRATTRILGDSPFNTDGSTIGLGTGQVSGVHLFVQPSASAGTLVKLSHVGDSGKCLDVVSSNTGVIGIDVAMTGAASAASAINVQHDGIGTGVGISAAGDYGLRVTAQNIRPTTCAAIFQTTHVSGTGTTVEVTSVGTGKVLDVNRSNGAAAQAAVTILDSVATASAALEVIAWASSAGTIIATNGGAGATVGATNTGTGSALTATIVNSASSASAITAATNGTGSVITASVTNAASTADALYLATVGNGRVARFVRSRTGATAALVTMHATDAADAGIALDVDHDGTGKGIRIRTNAGTGLDLECSGYGMILSVLGSQPAIFASRSTEGSICQLDGKTTLTDTYGTSPGGTTLSVTRSGLGGQAIQATGGIRTDALRITGGTPALGKLWAATDALGNGTWTDGARGDDTSCLTSIYLGTQALGNITFSPLNVPVQIPLDLTTTPLPAGYVCNDQWDTTTNLGAFTPVKNLSTSGMTGGVTSIRVTFHATKPGGWTATDVTLWIDKNGTKWPIGGAYVGPGNLMTISGVFDDKFTGTDAYTVWISSNVAGAQAALTSWSVRVSTVYEHTHECSDCAP